MEHRLENCGNTVTVFGSYSPRYVRTDRNGTKIYQDINCPRCAGHGESDNWWKTGRVCYHCGGSGKRPQPKEIKVYTREYADKLEARREAKAAAEAAVNAPTQEELAAQAERLAEARRNALQSSGFTVEGNAFLYTGNTYPIKDRIKASGGRWCVYLHGWIAPVDLGPIEGVTSEAVTAEELCDSSGHIDTMKCWNR